ncbi:MAG: CPBP family intramembrane metalloprotease [Anaerolineae bacterium]|nr:CPBP family intramembrane metalloprotease [Anaerolineae bacterium]
MTEKSHQPHKTIRPMSWGLSLLFFGLPAIMVIVCFHVIMPALISGGATPFNAYFVAMGVPLVVMLVASLVAYRIEGNPMTWAALKERFRLGRMNGKAWLWTIGTLVVISLGYGIASQISLLLVTNGIMPMPASLPAWLDPRNMKRIVETMDQAAGGLSGNWMVLITFVISLFFNIIGEEFWWRGYILPRQELALGKWVWVIHGLLWAFFHAFKWWDVIGLLPVTVGFSYVVYRLKNNTPGIILHTLFNGLGVIPILLGVLGVFA